MLCLWNLLLSLSLPLSFHVVAYTGESVKETQASDSDTAVQRGSPMFGTENVDFLGLPLTWPLSSSEQSDRQGVIGEYADLQESTETPPVYPDEKGLIISRHTDSAAEDASSKGSTKPQHTQEQHTLMYQPAETKSGSLSQSTQTRDNRPTFPASQNETALERQLPFLLSGSLPPDQDSTSPLSAGPGPSPEHPTPPVATGSLGWTTGPSIITQGKIQEGTVRVKETGDGLFDITDILHKGAVSMVEDTGKSPSFHFYYNQRALPNSSLTCLNPLKTDSQIQIHSSTIVFIHTEVIG